MRGFSRARALVLLAGAMATHAQPDVAAAQQSVREERGIHVTGTGVAEVTPDRARLLFAVETTASSARVAGQQNATTMDRVIAALVAAGVPRDSIETLNYSVFPEHEHDERGSSPRIRGYRVSNQLSVQTTRLNQIGALIDVALGAGANRIDGVSFGVRDPRAAQAEALRSAVERARASAETIARALGVSLGPVLRVSTSPDMVRPMPVQLEQLRVMDAAAAPPPTPIQPGRQSIHAQVMMVFAIGN